MRMLCRASAALVATLALLGLAVQAQEKVELKVGDKAPSFEATDDQGKTFKSSDVVGKKVLVIYFYPADFTGGCTKQACSFRDEMGKLKDKDVEVIGISGDSAKNHEEFKKYHKLNFTLLADEKGAIAKQFGVPVKEGGTVKPKELEGKEIKRGVTISRWTFVIDKEGKVANKEEKVIADQDSKRIIDILKELKNK